MLKVDTNAQICVQGWFLGIWGTLKVWRTRSPSWAWEIWWAWDRHPLYILWITINLTGDSPGWTILNCCCFWVLDSFYLQILKMLKLGPNARMLIQSWFLTNWETLQASRAKSPRWVWETWWVGIAILWVRRGCLEPWLCASISGYLTWCFCFKSTCVDVLECLTPSRIRGRSWASMSFHGYIIYLVQ